MDKSIVDFSDFNLEVDIDPSELEKECAEGIHKYAQIRALKLQADHSVLLAKENLSRAEASVKVRLKDEDPKLSVEMLNNKSIIDGSVIKASDGLLRCQQSSLDAMCAMDVMETRLKYTELLVKIICSDRLGAPAVRRSL